MTGSLNTLLTTAASRRGVFRLVSLALGSLAVSLLPVAAPVQPRRAAAAGAANAAAPDAGMWVCTNADCDPYIYDPAVGDADNIANPGHPVPPGTAFADLPDDWICPYCGSGKDWFRPLTR